MRQSMFSTCIQRRNYTCWEDKRPPLDRSNGQTNGRRSQGSKHHEATPETLEPTRPDLQLTTEDPYIRLAYPNIGNTLLVYCASTGATECCQNTSSYHYDSNFGNCALRFFFVLFRKAQLSIKYRRRPPKIENRSPHLVGKLLVPAGLARLWRHSAAGSRLCHVLAELAGQLHSALEVQAAHRAIAPCDARRHPPREALPMERMEARQNRDDLLSRHCGDADPAL